MTTSHITCPACGHADDVANETGLEAVEFLAQNVFQCSECNARLAYGKPAPRVVIEPFTDDRGRQFIRHRFQDPVTKADLYTADLDPKYAAMLATNVLSVVLS